jgi:ribosomal protein L21E
MSSARIVLQRATSKRHDILRSYKILLDDKYATKIKRGERVQIETSPGVHRIKATIDWAGSSTLNVEIQDGGTLYVTVAPTGNVFKSLFHPNEYISLTVEK